MYILAGAVAALGAVAFIPSARQKASSWGTVAVWYGMRLCTEAEFVGERLMAKLHDLVGNSVEAQRPNPEIEMVYVGDQEFAVHTRMFYNEDGEAQVVVGKTAQAVERDRPPCMHRVYGPTIRIKEADGTVRNFPVEFDGNYCLVGNVLFDPLFVAYWLQTRYDLVLDPEDTWETSFLGPGMVPATVSHKQRGVCTAEGIDVRELPEYREEPGSGGSEPWLLDLSGKPSP